ncbi:MAG: lipopolysaccharide heptosyltransferase II [Zetaproteobacteria bacterium]|nr:MAG: lipopolysaccharide heptosyltransferase II [Zetaproteobacteria bacterium]
MRKLFPPRTLLLLPPNWLGDVIMAQPAMRALVRCFAGAERLLVFGRPWLTDVLPYLNLGRNAFCHHDRVPYADLAFLFPNSFRSAWLTWRAGVRQRVGYRGQWRAILLTHRLSRRLDLRHDHHRLHYLDMLRQLDITVDEQQVQLVAPAEDAAVAGEMLAQRGLSSDRLLCIAPGAQFGGAKRYPAESYARICELLSRDGWHLVVLGTQTERPIGEAVLQRVSTDRCWNACGRTSLRQALQLVSQCRLLLCNDSGLMHVAAGLGRPTLALFGATDPARTAPSGPKVRVLYRPAPCSPCLQRECKVEGQPCMRNLPVDLVLDACREMLA